MAYRIRQQKSKYNDSIYVSIVLPQYRADKKYTTEVCYRRLGTKQELASQGIDDPVKYFQPEIDALNELLNAQKELKKAQKQKLINEAKLQKQKLKKEKIVANTKLHTDEIKLKANDVYRTLEEIKLQNQIINQEINELKNEIVNNVQSHTTTKIKTTRKTNNKTNAVSTQNSANYDITNSDLKKTNLATK